MIFRDSTGCLLDSASVATVASSAFMAKALALKKAMHMALDLNLKDVIFETDCEVLLKVVRKLDALKDWKCEAVIDDISFLKLLFPSC